MEQSNLHESLEEIENVIAEKEVVLRQFKALARLKKTTDFQIAIIDGFVKKRTDELFKTLTEPSDTVEVNEKDVLLKLEVIKDFKRYLGTENTKGSLELEAEYAQDYINHEEDYRTEITKNYTSEE